MFLCNSFWRQRIVQFTSTVISGHRKSWYKSINSTDTSLKWPFCSPVLHFYTRFGTKSDWYLRSETLLKWNLAASVSKSDLNWSYTRNQNVPLVLHFWIANSLMFHKRVSEHTGWETCHWVALPTYFWVLKASVGRRGAMYSSEVVGFNDGVDQ